MKVPVDLSSTTVDRIAKRSTGNRQSVDDFIIHLLDITEVNPLDKIPEEFEAYWQLEKYISRTGFFEYRKTGPNVDIIKARIIGSDHISSLDVYFKKQNGKYIRCRGEDSLENVEKSSESNP